MAESPFHERVQVTETDVLTWQPEHKYEVIICNPPFFAKSLPSPHAEKNRSKHETDLTLSRLLTIGREWVQPNGQFFLLLPYDRFPEITSTAAATGWSIAKQVLVSTMVSKKPFRVMSLLRPQPFVTEMEKLAIKQDDGTYTDEFLDYLRPFYLDQHYLRNMK